MITNLTDTDRSKLTDALGIAANRYRDNANLVESHVDDAAATPAMLEARRAVAAQFRLQEAEARALAMLIAGADVLTLEVIQ